MNDRPRVGARELGEAKVGVDGAGVADDREHRHVGVAVRVGEAVVEIVAVVARLLADEARLLGAGDDGAKELAGGEAVLDLEAVGDEARGAEVVGEALHQEVERARDEDDVVPLGAAALHEVARARDRGPAS